MTSRRSIFSLRHPLWRLSALLGLLASLSACMSAPQWAYATPPSQVRPDDNFSTLDLDWQDSKRQRAVPARLYLPHSAGKAPAPLLIFSHGMGGSRAGYSYIARDLASHGIASLHVQHAGSDRGLWQGNRLTTVLRLQQAAQDEEAIARVDDLRFALDQLLASPHATQIDATRIAAAGHSYGANTVMLATGARVERDGDIKQFTDPRIKAAVLISSPPFYGDSDFRAILQPIRLPTLHITSTGDVIAIPGYRSEAEDRIKVYDAIGSPQKLLAVFKDGSHSMFTDRLNTGGAVNPLVKRATSELVRLFLNDQFQIAGTPLAPQLADWRLRHAEILARLQQAVAPRTAKLSLY